MPAGLRGFAVGVTADRRGEEQTLLFRRLGVEVIRGPAIRTLPVSEDERLRSATEALIARPPDVLVANTALGMPSWFALAASWGLEEALRHALQGGTEILARGPKAAGAVIALGLRVSWWAPAETLSSVGDRLMLQLGRLNGRRVALQLHGDERQTLSARLRQAGAQMIELPVYRWTLPEDAKPARQLIEAVCNRSSSTP